MQRATLIALTMDDRLDSREQDHLTGLLNLTDHIIDMAKASGRDVPELDDLVLDQLAEL